MSVEVMSDVWAGFPGGGSELLTLLALADYGNDDGLSIHPSIDTLAHKVRVSESQVRRVIRSLEAKKFVMVVGNHGGGAAGTTRNYRLNVRLLKQLADKARAKIQEERLLSKKKPSLPDFDNSDLDTGSTHATPSMDARDGSHPCAARVAPMRETGSTHATLTTIEPSVEPPINHHIPPTAFASVAPTAFSPLDDAVADAQVKGEAKEASDPQDDPADPETGTALEVIPPAKQATRKRAVATVGADTETALQAACRATWTAYSDAYANRYGVAPLRNAKVNASIKGFVQRIGHEESPAVASYYAGSVNDRFVVNKMHDVGLLLSGAEGYRTQWATGCAMTATAARQADQTAANYSVAAEAKQIARARRAAREAAAAAGEDFL